MSAAAQRQHLDAARRLIAAQRPTEALEHILAIVRTRGGGELALLRFLDDAKASALQADALDGGQLVRMLNALQLDPDDDDDDGVDDDCIDDNDDEAQQVEEPRDSQTSFLEQQGRTAILRDAYRDGSSVLCPGCSALVSAKRFEAHRQLWCDAVASE